MYMAPIVRVRPASSALARRLVSAPVLVAAAAVMVPWLAVHALFSGAVLGAAALVRSPRALLQAVDYAGEIALGR